MDLEIKGQVITKVEVRLFDQESDSLEKIALHFGDQKCILSVNEDTDELIFQTNPEPQEGWRSPAWAEKVEGKTVAFYWVAANSDGYQDLFCLALDTFQPGLLISSAASELDVQFTTAP